MKEKLLMVFAMAAFGTLAVFVKSIELSSAMISFSRAILAILVIAVFKLLKRSPLKLKSVPGRELFLLFLSGIAMGFNWVLLFEAYKHITVSLATLCYYFSPMLVTVISTIVFKEKLNARKLICFIGSSAGLVLIVMPRGETQTDLTGVLLGLGAAVLYATVILLNKGLRSLDGIDRTLLQFISAAAVLAVYIPCTQSIDFSALSPEGLVNLLIVGFFHTGLCYCFYFTAIKTMKGQEIAVISYIDPLVAVLCSFFILGESVDSLQLAGGFLILVFAAINEISLKKKGPLRQGSSPSKSR